MAVFSKKFGIIAYPVSQSFSPVMLNAAFKCLKLNASYSKYKVPPDKLKEALSRMFVNKIKGYSVSVPHKEKIVMLLDRIDPIAKKIGAVNTVINDNGVLKGYNTDWIGVIASLKYVKFAQDKIAAVVLGAGGAARAVVFALKKLKYKNIIVLNRTLEKARVLAKEFKCEFGELRDYVKNNCDLLINTTMVGMKPKVNETLITAENLKKNITVFDVVYTPKKTKLIREAEKAGCKTILGYKMLLYQAAAQFELFTGEKPPIHVMEQSLLKRLS